MDYNKDKINSKLSIHDSTTWGDEKQRRDSAGLQVNELCREIILQKRSSFKMESVQYEMDADGHFLHSNLVSVLDKDGVLQFQKSGLGATHDETVKTIKKLFEL